jgi:hypothetical protein
MMKKHGAKVVEDFTAAAWRKFGMRIVVLAAYKQDGKPTVSLWV